MDTVESLYVDKVQKHNLYLYEGRIIFLLEDCIYYYLDLHSEDNLLNTLPDSDVSKLKPFNISNTKFKGRIRDSSYIQGTSIKLFKNGLFYTSEDYYEIQVFEKISGTIGTFMVRAKNYTFPIYIPDIQIKTYPEVNANILDQWFGVTE